MYGTWASRDETLNLLCCYLPLLLPIRFVSDDYERKPFGLFRVRTIHKLLSPERQAFKALHSLITDLGVGNVVDQHTTISPSIVRQWYKPEHFRRVPDLARDKKYLKGDRSTSYLCLLLEEMRASQFPWMVERAAIEAKVDKGHTQRIAKSCQHWNHWHVYVTSPRRITFLGLGLVGLPIICQEI